MTVLLENSVQTCLHGGRGYGNPHKRIGWQALMKALLEAWAEQQQQLGKKRCSRCGAGRRRTWARAGNHDVVRRAHPMAEEYRRPTGALALAQLGCGFKESGGFGAINELQRACDRLDHRVVKSYLFIADLRTLYGRQGVWAPYEGP